MAMRQGFTFICLLLFMAPLTGSLGNEVDHEEGWTTVIPQMTPVIHEELDWWERTTLDSNRNGIHDSLGHWMVQQESACLMAEMFLIQMLLTQNLQAIR